MKESGISWTDQTWNPIVGCSKVSAGCHHCWAERMAKLHYHGDFQNGWDGHVKLFPERLEQPLHWRKPRKIAVGLMGDLFHESVPDEFIDRVFKAMARSPRHIFQVLTKRAARMRSIVPIIRGHYPDRLEHVWLGVSVEDQATADERIPLLLQTPAAVRFVSAEPLLGRINLCDLPVPGTDGFRFDSLTNMDDEHFYNVHEKLDWVIVGGESGPGARPMHPDWSRSLRDQCVSAGVAFHFKQWGEWAPRDWRHEGLIPDMDCWLWEDGTTHTISSHEMPWNLETVALMRRIGKKSSGHLLDGKEYLEFPK